MERSQPRQRAVITFTGGEAALPTTPIRAAQESERPNNADHPSDVWTGDQKCTSAWTQKDLS